MTLLALTKHGGLRLAEVGFALAAVAGVLFAIGAAPGGRRAGTFLGGIALAVGAVLLIVAAHWGHYG